jgi:Ca2+-binding EF-hand superfamily protein
MMHGTMNLKKKVILELLKAEITSLCVSGDGNVSFEEFVEIVSNMGATTDRTADQEEKELRDAFRVSI